MSREVEDSNRRLLRARAAIARANAEPLDVRAIAAVAHIPPAHFSRCFRTVFGETPHRYLQRRRIERSMSLLRETDRRARGGGGRMARGSCAGGAPPPPPPSLVPRCFSPPGGFSAGRSGRSS